MRDGREAAPQTAHTQHTTQHNTDLSPRRTFACCCTNQRGRLECRPMVASAERAWRLLCRRCRRHFLDPGHLHLSARLLLPEPLHGHELVSDHLKLWHLLICARLLGHAPSSHLESRCIDPWLGVGRPRAVETVGMDAERGRRRGKGILLHVRRALHSPHVGRVPSLSGRLCWHRAPWAAVQPSEHLGRSRRSAAPRSRTSPQASRAPSAPRRSRSPGISAAS
jgi:hypothetical protein